MTDTSRLRELLEKATTPNPFDWYFPWRVDASGGKPLIVGAKSGMLFRGSIGTWDEARLIVEALNALPSLLDELDRLRSPVSKEALAAVEAGAAETLAAIQRAKEDQEYESLDRFQGRIAEREAIVAWVRDAATQLRSRGIDGGEPIAETLDITAAGIASGAHIKGGQEG